MSLTTEWVTPTGRVEKFTSYREPGDTFLEFNSEHDAAVVNLGGPQ